MTVPDDDLVTDRDELLAEIDRLQASLRSRDDYLAALAHELRSPLGVLILQLDVHERAVERAGLASLDASLEPELVRRQLFRLERLVQQMHDVSRIGRGELELELEDVELRAVVEAVLDRHAAEATTRGVTISRGDLERASGRWDPRRLAQVVTSLVSNALRHARAANVRVATSKTSNGARLVVSDDGCGIAPQDHARIFEQFGRTRASTQRGGLALGLWLSREIVRAHGGDIHLSSALGQGSTFEVSLPPSAPMR